ncbi:hypothetical protein KY285_011169 [Solanum tuberosum]|nr:hypothetical protein KY289_011742 [Solanum tuberosum]KAH0735462.1 hypothetical protein KY285_011169 [Solanum tuberosum]
MTLSQMVFNDQRVTEHFHPKIWICVSEDFNEKRLIKAIVESIEETSLGEMNLVSASKDLLVLDDVWNEDQDKWDNIREVLKVGASGASVLTTTRLEKVGSIMVTLKPYINCHICLTKIVDCLLMQRAFGAPRRNKF